MKICMIGLGSIGKRHTENIRGVLNKRKVEYQIDALRSRRRELPEDCQNIISNQFYQSEDLPDDYDIIFITNPTFRHYDTIREMKEKTKHLFIEKPLFESLSYDLRSLRENPGSVYYVACPLRHKNVIKYVKDSVLQNNDIISARIISTSYLPAWRSGADYRKIYSARDKMGGGVTLDLIHEWDYVLDLFGEPEKIMHMKGHMSNLEIDSDDVSIYLAKYENMFLEIHLDYIGQKTERLLQLFTNEKRIDVDLITDTIFEYKNNQMILCRTFPQEDFYVSELEYFFDCIEGKTANMNTIGNAYNTLKIALSKE